MTQTTAVFIDNTYVDANGHVHYAKYLDILSQGFDGYFSERFPNYLEDRSPTSAFGQPCFVRSLTIDYNDEILPGDVVFVKTFCKKIGNSSFTICQEISKVGASKPATICQTTFAMVGRVPVPDWIREKLMR